MGCTQWISTSMVQCGRLAKPHLFLALLLPLLLLFAPVVRGVAVPPRRGISSYVVVVDSCLHPETAAAVAADLQQHWRWNRASGACLGSAVFLSARPPQVAAWQDFLLLRVNASLQRGSERGCVSEWLRGVFLVLPRIGRISVVRVVEDAALPMPRFLASSSPPRGTAPGRKRRQQQRQRYPRRYFELPRQMKWTGRGVRIALLDTGLDPLLVSSSYQQQDSSNVGEARPLRMCTSFVPGLPCETIQDGHGTFSVSVMAGNVSFLSDAHDGNLQDTNENITINHSNKTSNSSDAGVELPLSRVRYLGLAPNADVHMLRVFNDARESRTSWCVAALNAALQWGADIVSLSFGGVDYYDATFTDKITELAAAGVVVVAATGNEGPVPGSVHNPADHAEVLAVGALGTDASRLSSFLKKNNNNSSSRTSNANLSATREAARWVSAFSGRGPSTWELPYGAARIRPDLVALGEHVLGVGRDGDSGALALRVSHGTSVAAPLVAGVVALCVEAMQDVPEWQSYVNVALIKRLLMGTAVEVRPSSSAMRLVREALHREETLISAGGRSGWWRSGKSAASTHEGISMTQTLLQYRNILAYSRSSQGAGEVCLMCALTSIDQYREQQQGQFLGLFAFPGEIDATGAHHLPHSDKETSPLTPCLLHWPYCEQPLFPSATPIAFNVSLYYPKCPAARLASSTLRVMITGARGMCSEQRRGQCKLGTNIEPTVAERLLSLRVDASPVLEAYSGWISMFAFSPANASSAKLTSPSPLGVTPAAVLEFYDLVVVTGHVRVAYTCFSDELEAAEEVVAAAAAAAAERMKGAEGLCGHNCVTVPFKIPVVSRPPRDRRVVFDVSHQWFYPPDFVPSDDAHSMSTPSHHLTRRRSQGAFECDSDHPHTNMAPLLLYLRHTMGLFVEVPLLNYLPAVFHANGTAAVSRQRRAALQRYYRSIGTLLLIDPELPLVEGDRDIIVDAVLHHELHLLLISGWYSRRVARGLSFYDATRDIVWSPGALHGSDDALPAEDDGTSVEKRTRKVSHELNGACHVPSLNALLRDLSQGTLQLDRSRVVDGDLVLVHTPSYSASFASFPRNAVPRGVDTPRYVGRINSAGALQWPPTQDVHHTDGHAGRGHSAGATMVCSMKREWAKELQELAKLEMENSANRMPRQAADVMRRVGPDAFVPLFGFAGVRGPRNDGGGNVTSGAGGAMGRVAVFTDSSGFGALPYRHASLRVLDRVVRDVSGSLLHHDDDEAAMARVRRTLLGLVADESRQPSFSFGIVHDLMRFLYTGDVSYFTEAAVCRRGVPVAADYGDANNNKNGHGTAQTTSAAAEMGDVEDNEEEFEGLLLGLLKSAPRRIAIAERVLSLLGDYEAATCEEQDDPLFLVNKRLVEMQHEDCVEHEWPLEAKVALLLITSVVVVVVSLALWYWRVGRSCPTRVLLLREGGERREKKQQ
ncbi:putative subtilisin-like serine peptidase [Trypanosoma grayi]|uniref:putative subtilisin-like serine peptidase n=1 Tax=Trypanosoma grayi TaxID=71804 RepID=UPI0004F3FEF2|nr:putative subtilisin-like serine peptidase [Trypanosoma grayi]KEG10724.1 putative subtilisin-like serine peptidase [Trypanosoma grayi]